MLPIKIALRFLKHSKGQTVLITLGIAIGVSVQLFIGLLIQGLQSSLIDKTIGNSPHITINSSIDNKTIVGYEEVLSDLKAVKGIKYISPAFDRPAFVNLTENTEPVLVRGLSLEKEDGIYKISKSLIDGKMPQNNQIVIGKDFAELSGYEVDSKFFITIPNIGDKELTVSGIYDLKVSTINKSWLITNLSTAQSLYESGDIISSIETQIENVFNSKILKDDINLLLENGYLANDWQTQNEELLSGLNGQSISSIMIQVFVIIAVVLGIASVLAISVLQKSKQLGILKAMGIQDTSASLIFLTQGLILGLLGALAGIALGLGLSVAFTTFALNPDGTALIPLQINAGFVFISGLIAVVASMGASLIPAVKSSKLNPIEVIRNG